MIGAAGGGPKPRDIVNALRTAVAALASVAGVVTRVNDAVGGLDRRSAETGERSPHGAVLCPPVDGAQLEQLGAALQELEISVNQLVTDELEDDLRTEQLGRAIARLEANVLAEADARIRVLEELTTARAQYDRLAQRVSSHELEVAYLKRLIFGNATVPGMLERLDKVDGAAHPTVMRAAERERERESAVRRESAELAGGL